MRALYALLILRAHTAFGYFHEFARYVDCALLVTVDYGLPRLLRCVVLIAVTHVVHIYAVAAHCTRLVPFCPVGWLLRRTFTFDSRLICRTVGLLHVYTTRTFCILVWFTFCVPVGCARTRGRTRLLIRFALIGLR